MQGIAQGALFGEAAVSGDHLNTQSLIFGTSTSGLIISLLRLCTKAAFPTKQAIHISSNLYFVVSGFICIFCIFIFSSLLKRKVYEQAEVDSNQEEHHDEVSDRSDISEGMSLLVPGEVLPVNIQRPSQLKHSENLRDIVQKTWFTLLSNTACYWVTLSIFPGVIAEDLHFNDNSWYPIVLIFIFNASDCAGKLCPRSIQVKFCTETSVLLIALLRCCFIPLFLIAPTGSVPIISILTILLGVTNGALTTINMVYATKLVNSSEQELCGSVSVFFLILGLNLGAFSGFLWLL